jgi:hypothetical protein
VTLVSEGSVWKYDDTGRDLGKDWSATEYDDGLWASGPAELGFGDAGEGRPERTALSFGDDDQNKHPTTYFRHSFQVDRPAELLTLALEVVRDDGCVVYLNGTEVGRSNMPEGDVPYSSYARGAVSGDDEASWYPIPVPPSSLREGTNVLAVEMHQNNGRSSDLSFNLRLAGFRDRSSTAGVESKVPSNESSD